MKKLFKLVLNTIPRPLLIRFSYAVRPLMAFLLRGTTFQDPIDGKKFRSFHTAMESNEKMYYHLPHSRLNAIDYFGYIYLEKQIFFQPLKKYYILLLNKPFIKDLKS